MAVIPESSYKPSSIELWTDETAREFAIRLSSDGSGSFRAASDLNSDYGYLALEVEFGKMSTRGWDFMLEILSNEWLQKAKSTFQNKNILARVGALGYEGLQCRYAKSISQPGAEQESVLLARARRVGEKRIRPHIQCRFCRLRYFGEEERTAHEKMWHAEKVGQMRVTTDQQDCENLASSIS